MFLKKAWRVLISGKFKQMFYGVTLLFLLSAVRDLFVGLGKGGTLFFTLIKKTQQLKCVKY